MENSIQVAPLRSRAKFPIYEFLGVRYYRRPTDGYYMSAPRLGNKSLHRDVWEHHNGEIPSGCAVHHKDGDRSNNDIGNLELFSRRGHASFHASEPWRKDVARINMREATKAATRWRRNNPERCIEFGRKAGAAARERRHQIETIEKTCEYCGKVFQVHPWDARRATCCSKTCNSAKLKKSGVYDEDRLCCICGGSFRVNRNKKKKTCSRDCKRSLQSKIKRLQHQGS